LNIAWVRLADMLRSHSMDIYIGCRSSADIARRCNQRSDALTKQRVTSNAGSKMTPGNGEPTSRKPKKTWYSFSAN
jgi:hypothetical protein